MSINWIRHLSVFIILVFFQVCIFNRIHLFGVATPLLYIYFILKLPMNMNRNWVVLLAFLMGFIMDRFQFSLGFHTLATTVIGFLRYYALKLFTPKDLPDIKTPSILNLGTPFFLRYTGSLVLIHLLILYSTESLMMFDLTAFFFRVSGSFVITMVLIYAIEQFNLYFSKK